jgi:hypothetical protein
VAASPALVTPPFADHPSGHNCAAGAIVPTLPALLRHRPRRVQRHQHQVRDDPQLHPPLGRAAGDDQRTRVGRDPFPHGRRPGRRARRKGSPATLAPTTFSRVPDASPTGHGTNAPRPQCPRAQRASAETDPFRREQAYSLSRTGSGDAQDATATVMRQASRDSRHALHGPIQWCLMNWDRRSK